MLRANRIIALGFLAIAPISLRAQFSNELLTNASYWGDGKAEVDLYEAQLKRAGELRKCELLMIVSPERVDPKTFARVDDPKRADALSALRLCETWTAPLGLVVEQAALNGLWRATGALARLSLVGTDSSGNFGHALENTEGGLVFRSESYREASRSEPVSSPPPNAIFYDELPWRVRTIDWHKSAFEVPLGPPLVNAKIIEFKPAQISWRRSERRIEVTVRHAGGIDNFSLDQRFPYLVREWKMADGSQLKLKRDLKVNYWNYTRNGDRERALNNPMLGHPD